MLPRQCNEDCCQPGKRIIDSASIQAQLDVMLDVNRKDEKSIAEVVVGAGSCLVGSEGSS